jgi:hypothetical protein
MLRRSLAVCLTLAGTVVMVACSDADGGAPERSAYVDAFVAVAEASGDPAAEDSNRCFAESAVDAIGIERLERADVTPDEIRENGAGSPVDLGVEVTDGDGEEYYDRLSDCLDVRDYLLGILTGGAELADESVSCLEEAFDEALVRRVVVTDFVQGSEAETSEVADELDRIYTDCAPAE